MLRDHHRLTEIFQGIWAQLGEAPPGDQLIEERRAMIDGVRHEMGGVESLDALNESALIRRYRELKHGLGNFYFHPDLLLSIQETNLVFKSRIQKLYRQEEQRIVAEYQRVFELEREVPFDTDLDRELVAFREEIERFEKQLQKEEFRLGDIAQIRQKVRDLLPRLTAGRTTATGERPSVSRMGQDTGEFALSRAAAASAAPMPSHHEELLGDYYRRLVDALREINPPDLAPERVVLKPEVFALRIEAREVEAYRRIFGKAECDRELEQFLLEAAALRIRINEEAHDIASLLDETSVTGDAVVFARARLTCRSADAYLWRFNHVLQDLMMAGEHGRVPAGAAPADAPDARLLRPLAAGLQAAVQAAPGRNPGLTVIRDALADVAAREDFLRLPALVYRGDPNYNATPRADARAALERPGKVRLPGGPGGRRAGGPPGGEVVARPARRRGPALRHAGLLRGPGGAGRSRPRSFSGRRSAGCGTPAPVPSSARWTATPGTATG